MDSGSRLARTRWSVDDRAQPGRFERVSEAMQGMLAADSEYAFRVVQMVAEG
jgi:hypothetical protein